MRSITPVLDLSEYRKWETQQNEKTLVANKLMWRKMHDKELRRFYDDIVEDATLEGVEEELPPFEMFVEIGFVVFAFNLCWDQTVQGEIDRITAPQPYNPR